jgi:hypothetical protein
MLVLLPLMVLASSPATMKVSWLGLELEQRSGGEIIVVKADAPAAPKVAVGDRLVTVLSGDHPGKLAGVTLCELWPKLVGPMGEEISLRFVRAGKAFEATLKRTDPPGLEAKAKAAVPAGLSPDVAQHMAEAQRSMLRAMALQEPDDLCGQYEAPLNTDTVNAFQAKVEKTKTPCDLKWIRAQPEVESVQKGPDGVSVFLKGGGAPFVIHCD